MEMIDNSLLESLSESERLEVERVLKEYINSGDMGIIRELLESDYEEIPVDVETFVKDKRYLGNATYDSTGRFTVFPYWMEKLKDIFPDNINTNYTELLLTGATGIGKSEMAVLVLLYMLYRTLCLKDPYAYYRLKPTDEITFGFLNITLDLAKGVAWQKCQASLQSSPWFLEHGTLVGITNIEWQPKKGIKLIYGSRESHVLGKAIFCMFLDEINDRKNKSIAEQQKQTMKLYYTIKERMKSRFISQGGLNPTMMIMASSKRTDSAFLETYIEDVKKNNFKDVLIIDEPRYVVKPPENYSGKKFAVAVGNKFLASEIIPDGANVDEYIKSGHQVIWVPIEEKESFIKNIDEALTNVAGISSSNVVKFIAGATITQCINEDLKNPFTKEVISLGTRDDYQISDFFDKNVIPEELFMKPVFIHIDTSLTGDKTGISAVCINGTKRPTSLDNDNIETELKYRHLFTVGIKAPKADQISLEKNRLFIYFLKNLGWNIKGVSCDGFQSADTLQILESKRIPVSKISADIVVDKQPLAYNTLKSGLVDKRIEMIYLKELIEEMINLERDNFTGKVDHPRTSSKDEADSLAGAIYGASKYKSDYVYYYGEDMDLTMELSGGLKDDKQQVMIDLVNSMKKSLEQPKSKDIIKPPAPVNQDIDDEFGDYDGYGLDGTIFIPETISGDIIVF